MPERSTAADRLRRLLWLLPAAEERELSVADAAWELGVDESTILADLDEVMGRDFYHPAGWAVDLRVDLDGDRIRAESHGKFSRPVRLGPQESVATTLALRRFAAGLRGDARDRVLAVAERIGAKLSSAEPDGLVERIAIEEAGESAGIRMALRRAASERIRCRVVYATPRDIDPAPRMLDPYAVVNARGAWYVVGYCGRREHVAVFRADRFVDVEITDQSFEAPDDFDLDAFLEGGRMFRAQSVEKVRVRYTGLSGSRVREAGPYEEEEGGSAVIVTYDVADPGWVVRQVLHCGGDAEVVEPDHVRQQVGRAARILAGLEVPANDDPPGP